MSTMKDVAKHTGLSIATISKYLNGGNVLEKNKILIEEAIEALDYKVNEIARGLKTNKTKTIGVLLPNLDNMFFTSIISSIENILIKEGYSIIVCDYHLNVELEKSKFEFLLNKMVDGIVLVSSREDTSYIKELNTKIPIIMLDRIPKDIVCDVVVADNLNASYNAVERLITKNHKRIAIICGPRSVYTASERYKGYCRVFEDYNMKIDNELVKFGKYCAESGYELMNELLTMKEPPTAVYVTSYDLTVGAIMAINEKGVKIPEQLSFIGFDNMHLAKLIHPPIAMIVQPMQLIGEKTANILLKRLNKDYSGFPSINRLKTDFLINESIKKV